MDGTSPLACGKAGAVCQECAIHEQCLEQRCQACGPLNCTGCCSTLGACLSGGSDVACGQGGEPCTQCDLFTVCRNARCQ